MRRSMFNKKTLFVVGAGASSEVNLPTGKELKLIIADKVDMRFDYSDRISGDADIFDALRTHARGKEGGGNVDTYLHAGWRIKDAMPQAISIDNFIDSYYGDEKIEICGKLAIAKSILEAEKSSLLSFERRRVDSNINFSNLEKTWFDSINKLLTQNCHREKVGDIFKNITFISFNYDRCIEHFFYHSLQNYYGVDAEAAAEIMLTLNVFHPYGTVGDLPWYRTEQGVDFGADLYGKQLLSSANGLKTFTEQIDDAGTLADIRNAVAESEGLVFLGFAFHKQNMELIKPDMNSANKKAYLTTKGISDSGLSVIRDRINGIIESPFVGGEIFMKSGLTCSDLFDEHWETFSDM